MSSPKPRAENEIDIAFRQWCEVLGQNYEFMHWLMAQFNSIHERLDAASREDK